MVQGIDSPSVGVGTTTASEALAKRNDMAEHQMTVAVMNFEDEVLTLEELLKLKEAESASRKDGWLLIERPIFEQSTIVRRKALPL